MTDGDHLKLFHVSHSMLRADLNEVGRKLAVDDLQPDVEPLPGEWDSYYAQFEMEFRTQASVMARHYEIFYCLENSIRRLVSSQLLAEKGASWWDDCVPQSVKDNAKSNVEKEREAGITVRSADLIDYTTFGELHEIIQANWDVFADTFNNRKSVTKVLSGLNLLRGPIAHCAMLAEDEVQRLQTGLKDWFRLMG